MADQSTKVFPIPLQSLASASVIATYLPVGTGITMSARVIYIINASSASVTISWDGINDHDFLLSNTTRTYEVGTQKGTSAPALDIPLGTTFFVKGTAGTGTIYVAGIAAVTPPMNSLRP